VAGVILDVRPRNAMVPDKVLGDRRESAMALIGVCEDDPAVRRVLVRSLEWAGYEVLAAHNGSEAVRIFGADRRLNAIVMDIGLPDADGRDVCQALKATGQLAPVLFLTALDAMHERLAGFSAGADDYVTKPFELKEVLARLEVLVRRGGGSAVDVSGLVLDPITHSVRTAAGEATLTPTEFRMLAAVAGRPGEVVRRRVVVAAAWPDGAVVSENTIDSFMRRVRAKLDAAGATAQIETVRGVGFRLSS
jgi:two-component system, OmpR family, response regulator